MANNTVLILLIITLIWIEKSEQNVAKSRLKRYIHTITIHTLVFNVVSI